MRTAPFIITRTVLGQAPTVSSVHAPPSTDVEHQREVLNQILQAIAMACQSLPQIDAQEVNGLSAEQLENRVGDLLGTLSLAIEKLHQTHDQTQELLAWLESRHE